MQKLVTTGLNRVPSHDQILISRLKTATMNTALWNTRRQSYLLVRTELVQQKKGVKTKIGI